MFNDPPLRDLGRMKSIGANRSLLAVAIFSLVARAVPAQAGTETSTSGFRFPEEGGVFERAPMPEGGVTYPWGPPSSQPSSQPAGGDDRGHADEHGHGHGHAHGDEHGHGHGHAHGHEHGHAHGDEHGHGHGHAHGHEHGHAHEPGDERDAASDDEMKLRVRWEGYLKVIAETVENDPESTFIGRNDGFRNGNARIGLTAAYGEKLRGYMSIEASVASTEDFNDPNAELTVGPRDLYVAFDFSRHAGLQLGRFKAPYDLGELEPEGDRIFIDSPLESRGVAPTQGFEVDGMRQGRQIGVMLGRERLGLSTDGFDVGYALALTNGRTNGLALNDNDRPAGFARFSFYLTQAISLHVAGFSDTRTVGELPNLYEEEVKGAETSLVLRLGDLRVEGQALYQRMTFPTTGAGRVNVVGFHAQWSYRIGGVEAAYRFAYYDPNHRFDVDAVREHTLGLSYRVERYPLRFTLNATLAGEEPGRDVENDRVGLLTQFTF